MGFAPCVSTSGIFHKQFSTREWMARLEALTMDGFYPVRDYERPAVTNPDSAHSTAQLR